jgi:hypothetical protein
MKISEDIDTLKKLCAEQASEMELLKKEVEFWKHDLPQTGDTEGKLMIIANLLLESRKALDIKNKEITRLRTLLRK